MCEWQAKFVHFKLCEFLLIVTFWPIKPQKSVLLHILTHNKYIFQPMLQIFPRRPLKIDVAAAVLAPRVCKKTWNEAWNEEEVEQKEREGNAAKDACLCVASFCSSSPWNESSFGGSGAHTSPNISKKCSLYDSSFWDIRGVGYSCGCLLPVTYDMLINRFVVCVPVYV